MYLTAHGQSSASSSPRAVMGAAFDGCVLEQALCLLCVSSRGSWTCKIDAALHSCDARAPDFTTRHHQKLVQQARIVSICPPTLHADLKAHGLSGAALVLHMHACGRFSMQGGQWAQPF